MSPTAILGRLHTLSSLIAVCEQARAEKKRIVLCHGVFDVIHPGHLEHLREAKAMGDLLIVSITSDKHVTKGPGRPVFDHNQRLQFMANLLPVDYVMLTDEATALLTIKVLRPDIYAKGPDYRERKDGNFARERAAVEKYGGQICFTSGPVHSSSQIINNYFDSRPPDVESYLRGLREKYSAGDMLEWLGRIAQLKILAFGEPICDEYIYVLPRGKSPKESLITYEATGEIASYAGGIHAISFHLNELGALVVVPVQAKPIMKIRYVEEAFVDKVFSLVKRGILKPDPYPERERYDLTIAADYGHGLFQTQADCRRFYGFGADRPFLGLTVQSNSLNWGYNRLTKWPQADYVVVDREELHLACGVANWDGKDIDWWAEHERRRMSAKLLAVTLGHEGCRLYDGDEIEVAPALSTRIVDRMGAGDAFLAVTAPLAHLGAPKPVIAFLGSVAAGIKVGLMGNQPVEKGVMQRWVKALLA